MKNLINSKLAFAYSASIIATLFMASSCVDNKKVDVEKVAEQENRVKMATDNEAIVVIENDNSAKFLLAVAEMQLEDISLGKLAQQKGTSSHVKELGKMMVDDHTKSFGELKALSQSKSISIPMSLMEDSQEAYDDLNEKTGNDFGKAYSERVVKHHEHAIGLFEEASTDSEDQDVRTWATNKLPGLRTHLAKAEACKKECDEMKS